MPYTIRAWFDAFAVTQFVEVPVYVLLMRNAVKKGLCERPATLEVQVLVAFGASAVTHPQVWFVIPRLALSYNWYVIVAEAFAVVVEAFYFYSCRVVFLRRALVWAVVANGASVGIGFLLRYLIGWP